ncbi:MAG: carboxymuconolactone decarboxylase family protein [Bacillota bacterium]
MPRISTVEFENASEEAKREYSKQIAKHGRITNMKKTLLHNVPSFKALMEWYTLRDEAVKVIGDFGVNVFCHAISSYNNCLICSTFFRRILKDSGYDPDNLKFDEKTQLIVDFGKACVDQPPSVDDKMFEKLKKFFSDSEIVLLTAFAGMMIATNLINNVLDVELDEYLSSYTKR